MSEKISGRTIGSEKEPLPESIQTVFDALKQIKFGAIQLTVHDGRLVQVDVTERKRFAS